VLTPVANDPQVTPSIWALVWTLAIVGACIACWDRAREYKRYQIEEMVATVAHWLCLVGRPVLEGHGGPGAAVVQRELQATADDEL
jgi:hypothetical protein